MRSTTDDGRNRRGVCSFEGVIPEDDHSRAERIRGLIDEIDRVRRESERVTRQVERDLKRPFWPERRRTPRMPGRDEYDDDTRSG